MAIGLLPSLIVPSSPEVLVTDGTARVLGRKPFKRVAMTDQGGVIRRPQPFRVEDPYHSNNAEIILNDDGYIANFDITCLEVDSATVLGERAIILNDSARLITDSHHPEHNVGILAFDERRSFERVPLDRTDNGYVLNDSYLETINIDEPTILLTSMEADNYGAFLLRALAKIIIVNEIGLNKEKILIASHTNWQRRILTLAGIDPSRIIQHDAAVSYRVSKLIIPSLRVPNFFLDDGAVEFFQELRCQIGRTQEVPTGITRRVYVSRLGRSRANPHHRAMQNEEALVELLTDRGFCIFEPELHSFEVQTQVFGQADCVMGPGGAGMFNTIFCRPGTTVISLEPQRDWLVLHANIFASMGHRYGLVVGGSDMTDPSAQKRWKVDMPTMKNLVDNII